MTRWLLPVLVLIPVLGLAACSKKDAAPEPNKTTVTTESKPESKVASNKHHRRHRDHDKPKSDAP